MFVFIKKPECKFPFEIAHYIGYRILGWYGHNKMDMVRFHGEFQNLHQLLLFTQLVDLLTCIFSSIFFEYSVPILWTKDNVILAFIE